MTIGCHVCGATTVRRQNSTGKPGIWACQEHFDRIKCAIAGCHHTRAGKPISEWICSTHWRRYCPPRSLRRRAYLAFFRKAKRHGWSDELADQYWRFWDTLVSAANAKEAGGHLDMATINAMFGWVD